MSGPVHRRGLGLAATALSVFLLAAPVLAYDGEEDVAEGWTFRVCGLAEAGYPTLPAHECPDRMCPVADEFRDGDLVFSNEELQTLERAGLYCRKSGECTRTQTTDMFLSVTRVDQFNVFLKLKEHDRPFGHVYANFLCDDARPK